jgi:hypothetical protein
MNEVIKVTEEPTKGFVPTSVTFDRLFKRLDGHH